MNVIIAKTGADAEAFARKVTATVPTVTFRGFIK